MGARTALRFPAPDLRISRLPGPILLLLDFLRPAAIVLPRSTVAFSFSPCFWDGNRPPIDLRDLRVGGSVASPVVDILTVLDLFVEICQCFVSAQSRRGTIHPCLFSVRRDGT